MAYFEDTKNRTMIAGQALATQFIFVVMAADGQVDPVGTAGARADGVLLTTATAAGQAVTVAYDGRVNVLAGGTIARGDQIASTNAGKAATATTGQTILGYAEEAAVDGEIMTVRLERGRPDAAA